MDSIEWDYCLADNGGSNNIDLPVLLPEGTRFYHEYGIYEVTAYLDNRGAETRKMSDICVIICERRFDQNEIKAGKHRQK